MDLLIQDIPQYLFIHHILSFIFCELSVPCVARVFSDVVSREYGIPIFDRPICEYIGLYELTSLSLLTLFLLDLYDFRS